MLLSPSSYLKSPWSNLISPSWTLLLPSSVKRTGYLTQKVLKIAWFPTKCPQAPLAPLAAFSRSAGGRGKLSQAKLSSFFETQDGRRDTNSQEWLSIIFPTATVGQLDDTERKAGIKIVVNGSVCLFGSSLIMFNLRASVINWQPYYPVKCFVIIEKNK